MTRLDPWGADTFNSWCTR